MPFPIDRDEIAKTEEMLGVRFPASHAERMLRNNGGELNAVDDVWRLHPFRDSMNPARIARTANDIATETRNWRTWPGAVQAGVVIADNGTGDVLVLMPRPDQPDQLADAVYWWDHETGELNSIAEGLAELLNQDHADDQPRM